MSKTLKYKTGRIASWQLTFLAFLALLVGCVLLTRMWPAGLALILSGATVVSLSYGVEVNPGEKKYRQYYSVLTIPLGGWRDYNAIEKIFINQVNISQDIYYRVNLASTVKHIEYQGFMKFTDGKKVALRSEKKKGNLMLYLKRMAKELKVNLEDNTIE